MFASSLVNLLLAVFDAIAGSGKAETARVITEA
jgi:hypothetical protein